MFRKTRHFIPFLLAAFLVSVTDVRAQGSSDGSIYSGFGIGELRSFSSSQIQALGGGGTALPGLNYINFNNPAGLADQIYTRAAIGVLFQSIVASDASNNTSKLTNGALNNVQFAFPLKTRKLGVGLSFEPYSRVNYFVRVPGQLPDESTIIDTTAYRIEYEGRGGLQQVNVGGGYRLNRYVNVGVSSNFIFGVIDDVRNTTFTGSFFENTRVTSSTRLSGVTGTVGINLAIPRLLGNEDYLFLGTAVTLPVTLKGSRLRSMGESLDIDTLGNVVHGSMKLPMSIRFGLAYQPDARWTIVADGVYEPWSDFSSDFGLTGYQPGSANQFRNRMRFSSGIEFYPAGRRRTNSFLNRTAFRIGGYFDQSYVNPAPDVTDLRTLAATFGLSLPSTIAGTRLDLNFEVGTRGVKEQNLVQDTFYRLSANVNISELWFEKRKLR